jgi:hypothetical protein
MPRGCAGDGACGIFRPPAPFGGLGQAGRLDLLGLLELKLELFQRQALGPSAEAMAP